MSEVAANITPRTKKKKRGWLKRLMPRTLLGRSFLILVLPILLIQVITAFVFFDRHWSKMTSRLSYAVAGEIAVIGRAIEEGASTDTVGRITTYVSQNLGLLISYDPDAQLEKDDAQQDWRVWESFVSRRLAAELADQISHPFVIHADFEEKWVEVSVQLAGGVLNVSLPQRRLFSSSGYVFLIWMFCVSFLLLIIAMLFMRNQIRPIRRLAVAAEWFGRGRDSAQFKLEGAHEVRQAGQAFLDMRRRIRRQIEQRAMMLAGVSHDLRTPLTRIKLQLEMLDDCPDVEALRHDVSDMERMITGYLDFVRGEGDEQVGTIGVHELLSRVLARAGAPEKVKRTLSEIPDSMTIMVRPMAMERALSNLVLNAVKYADHVWVSADLREDEERLFLFIDDDGPGMPVDQYEDVFKPFYRIDESRNTDTGGVGLGLSIAMDIVHAHGGHIWLDKSEHGGLRVCVRLPY